MAETGVFIELTGLDLSTEILAVYFISWLYKLRSWQNIFLSKSNSYEITGVNVGVVGGGVLRLVKYLQKLRFEPENGDILLKLVIIKSSTHKLHLSL